MTQRMARGELAQRVAQLHADGHGRNEIGRRLGVGGRIVTTLAREQGLTFDRKATSTATAARTADSRERRSRLAAAILDAAEDDLRSFGRMPKPTTEHGFDQRSRFLANVSRAVESTVRAAPLEEDRFAETRAALEQFASSLTVNVEQQRLLEEYQKRYGPIDLPADTYGLPEGAEPETEELHNA